MSNVDTHRALQEAWNRRDFAAYAAALSADVTYTDHSQGLTMKSPAEVEAWARGWAAAFSDGQISGATYLDAGDVTVAQYHGRGTNDGPFGSASATGARVDVPMCEVLNWGPDGKVVRGEAYYDLHSILSQLGLASPAAP